jgi:hypothetical protein
MITKEQAYRFACDWIECWNSHDLDRILAHYADDFEMSSPVIVDLMDEPSGRIRGKDKIRAYWAKALQRQPGLHFELIDAFAGTNSLVVYYRGPRGHGAEVFWFDAAGNVFRSAAHYSVGAPGWHGAD